MDYAKFVSKKTKFQAKISKNCQCSDINLKTVEIRHREGLLVGLKHN